ncbi:MAG TPA: pyruvate ferredoxin oxidoreductase, partial [Alphaproteobacteria bacterium]|nr:pyruvate ferredoxin oxidoreductase [Alphaproteobacteria bacterium]
CPVMVCMDGFILTHAYERVDIPTQAQVDAFLPPYEPVQVLDPAEPYSIGAMVGPDAYTEVRYLAHEKQLQALRLIPEIGRVFEDVFGRTSCGLVYSYRTEGADVVAVALGSVNGTIKEVVDAMRADGAAVGSVSVTSFRPFPLEELRAALGDAKHVVVIEKNLAPGLGGVVASDVRMALRDMPVPIYTVIAGLGGRPITMAALQEVLAGAGDGKLPDMQFLDLDHGIVEHEIIRSHQVRRSGPTAENILRNPAATITQAED